jgi:hypothetical protein
MIKIAPFIIASTLATIAHANPAYPPDGCEHPAAVVHLERFGDNNLSVHSSPIHPSARNEIDELFPGDRVCIIGGNGDWPWLHIQYTRDGRNRTGWAHGRYLQTDAGRLNTPTPSAPPPVAAETEPYEVKVDPPICEITIVTKVYPAGPPGDGFDGDSRCGACASGIAYENGKGQSGEYSYVPAMERSRPGDRVQLCLVSFLAGCPAGDDRGHEYTATNLRTHEAWTRHDATHMCGGA